MPRHRVRLLTLGLVATAGGVAHGQQLAFSLPGGSATESAGSVIVRIHDYDLDGTDDLAVGAPGFDVGTAWNTGRVSCVSGRTGAVLAAAIGGSGLERFGSAIVLLDDLSFDGVPDLAVGAPGFGGALSNGAIRILSGANMQGIGIIVGPGTGARIGERLVLLDDQTGDGRDEIATGARGLTVNGLPNAGAAIVYDPASGAIVRRFDGVGTGDGLGTDIATIADFSGDGRRELIAGAPGADPFGNNGAGSIQVFDPAVGVVLKSFFGLASNDGLGATCAGLDDVDFDGTPDLLGGAPGATVNGLALAGSVFVFSLMSGHLLMRYDGAAANDQLGRTLAALDDLDHDFVADFAIGSPTAVAGTKLAAGRVTLINGRTLSTLFRIEGATANAEYGGFVGPLGDLDANGRNDFAIGWPSYDGTLVDQGSARVHWGESPSLVSAGTGQIGTPYELRMLGYANESAYLLVGAGSGNLATPLGTLCLSTNPFPIVLPIGAFDAEGLLVVTGIVPNTGLPGPATAYLQVAFMAPFAPAKGWLGQCATLTIFP